MPLPIAHGLAGASIAAISCSGAEPHQKRKAIIVGVALAISPDLDLLLAWGLDLGDKWHGSFSHSITFAIAAGLMASALMGGLSIRRAMLYGAITLSHTLMDAATSREFGAVELLWPFSTRSFGLGLFDYFEFTPNLKTNPLADDLLRAFIISLYELLIFTPVFLLALFISRRASQSRDIDQTPVPAESARD